MNITKAIVQLRERLIMDINRAGLPPVIVGFVLDGIQNEVERLTAEDLRKEEADNADRADADDHAE
mgnify:FL=1